MIGATRPGTARGRRIRPMTIGSLSFALTALLITLTQVQGFGPFA